MACGLAWPAGRVYEINAGRTRQTRVPVPGHQRDWQPGIHRWSPRNLLRWIGHAVLRPAVQMQRCHDLENRTVITWLTAEELAGSDRSAEEWTYRAGSTAACSVTAYGNYW